MVSYHKPTTLHRAQTTGGEVVLGTAPDLVEARRLFTHDQADPSSEFTNEATTMQ
jgi:hypothetical protein